MTEHFKNDFLQYFISEILNFCFVQKLVSHHEITLMYAKINVHTLVFMVYGSGLDITNKQSILTFTQTYVYYLANLQHFVNHPNVKIKTSTCFFCDIEQSPPTGIP